MEKRFRMYEFISAGRLLKPKQSFSPFAAVAILNTHHGFFTPGERIYQMNLPVFGTEEKTTYYTTYFQFGKHEQPVCYWRLKKIKTHGSV